MLPIPRVACSLLLVSFALLQACTVRVFSPPHAALPLESSAPLGAGKRAVRGEVAGGVQVFGPGVSAYRAEYRHGVRDRLDVSVAASAMRLHSVPPGNPHTGIYSARVGLKYAVLREFALSTGLAPGASTGGGFLAYDAGLTVGAENPYFVPFFTARALLSVPVASRRVRIDTERSDVGSADGDDPRGIYFRTPVLTRGWQLGIGFKVPLRHATRERVLPSLACAAGATGLKTKHDDSVFFTMGCGVEVGF